MVALSMEHFHVFMLPSSHWFRDDAIFAESAAGPMPGREPATFSGGEQT
jgi:hypothetical protein